MNTGKSWKGKICYSHHRASTVPLPQKEGGFLPSQSCGQLSRRESQENALPFKGVPKVRAKKKALASPFGRGVIPLIGEMSAKQTKGSGRGTSRTNFEEIFGEGLLPQSASLTAPSKKEPDSAVANSFDFSPLSLAVLDSSFSKISFP